MTERSESERHAWAQRPWIMAGVGASGGLLVHFLTDHLSYYPVPTPETVLRQAGAAGVAIATVSFLITADRKRIGWAAAFAVAWGLIMGLVGYSTGAYNRGGDLVEFPFLSGLLAIAVASPLFQTLRDEGQRSLPYAQVHRYAWTDAIIGGASLAFTGLTFLLAFLLASLFDAIGISLLKDLIDEGWFDWMLAGAAFGAASAVLREKDPLLGTLQRLVMLVFSVLAPVLAGALAIYLVALPATGFAGLWKSGLPETPLLLSTAAFAVVFLNAIIGDSPDDRSGGKLWRITEGVLLFAVLPLGALALVSMGMRVNQYGWTPERLWGVIACIVAIAYGAAAWLAGIRGRGAFDVPLRESQKWLAVGLCGLALFLALPIVDFGTISARSQLARLQAGKVKASEFDWAAMAFDFGPSGREALKRMSKTSPKGLREMASSALESDTRFSTAVATETVEQSQTIDERLRVMPVGSTVTPELRNAIVNSRGCLVATCAVTIVSADEAVVAGRNFPGGDAIIQNHFVRNAKGDWQMVTGEVGSPDNRADLATADIEIRTKTYRQLFVDGKRVGPPFE